MKKRILIMSVFALGAFTTKSYPIHNESNLTVNTKVSTVEWIGKKVTGQHSGTINVKEGSLHLHDGNLTGGKIVIDMTSIKCTDMEGEYGKKLIGHLNSTDFFDVANHKTATLNLTSVKKIEGNKHTLSGNLIIKGISKPVEFPCTLETKEGKFGAYAEMKIDRTLYDIKYNSGKFFEGLGDKMIDDEFIIKFKIAAK